jgi:hypothetical protein
MYPPLRFIGIIYYISNFFPIVWQFIIFYFNTCLQNHFLIESGGILRWNNDYCRIDQAKKHFSDFIPISGCSDPPYGAKDKGLPFWVIRMSLWE